MTTTLITGANKGLGFETARQLLAAGHDVWIGSRDPGRGEEAARRLGGRFVRLDVTDDDSVSAAAATVGGSMESSFPSLAYGSSKAAVNMITVQYAKAFPAIRINCVDPGYTATDLNGHRGTQTVDEGAAIIVRMARIGADGPTGGYFDRAGRVPW